MTARARYWTRPYVKFGEWERMTAEQRAAVNVGLDALPAPSCRYCAGSGWFYSEPELGPCSCPKGRDRNG